MSYTSRTHRLMLMDPLGTLKVQNQMLVPSVRSLDFEWYISPSNLFPHLSIRGCQASLSYLVMLRNTGGNARGHELWRVDIHHDDVLSPTALFFPSLWTSGTVGYLFIYYFLLGWQMKFHLVPESRNGFLESLQIINVIFQSHACLFAPQCAV